MSGSKPRADRMNPLQSLPKIVFDEIEVDLRFEGEKPIFADLLQICSGETANWRSTGRFNFQQLRDLGFDQVDDYYAVRSSEDKGGFELVWLYPLVGSLEVYHHPGPYDGLRLHYTILRNPASKIEIFLRVVRRFMEVLPVKVIYRQRGLELGNITDLNMIEADMRQAVAYWRARGIEPGSKAALLLPR